ncbi:MAG TPA: SDR family oxidoreductase [Stellaceae bacterium]|nr:SDR family oxidoreductase [Stellaceae bacterium]
MPGIFASGLLRGKTALVTGGGTGIGLAIARALGEVGAAVTIAGRRPDILAAAAGTLAASGIDVAAETVNIRDEAAVARLFEKLAEARRFPDILVNNAGGQFSARAFDITANGFRAVVDLNLTGTWLVSQAFARQAVGRGGGRIVNIVLSVASGAPMYAHGAAARAGVINLTKTLAIEWAPHGILVNSVAPGLIRTEALSRYDPAEIEAGVAALPLRRMGESEEVAHAVVFLASPGGDYVTGTTLFVDGGKHLARPLTGGPAILSSRERRE